MINGYLTINIFRRGRFTFPLKELEGVIPIYCPTWYHPTTSQPTKAAVDVERTPLNTVSPLRAAYLIGCSTPFRAIEASCTVPGDISQSCFSAVLSCGGSVS